MVLRTLVRYPSQQHLKQLMIASDLSTLFLRPTASAPKYSSADLTEIRSTLENGSDSARIACLKTLVISLVNGEKELVEGLLMHFIRFILPLKNKTIKKLLLYLFENVNKVDNEGNLRQEFILVCNAWRNDLQHPNEYVRGATLRFLCHIKEPELLEPLVPSIRNCLEHENAHVRRNAIYAAFSIFKTCDFLLPDAPEAVESLLSHESDLGCQRAAFFMLSQTEPARAQNYFNLIAGKLAEQDSSLQVAVIEFIRRDFAKDPEAQPKLMKTLLNVLKRTGSSAAKYECACTLLAISHDEEVIKSTVDALVSLAVKEPDNSVKLVVLNKLQSDLVPRYPNLLQSCVLDLLRVLSSPDPSVRRLCLALVKDYGVSNRTALEIVQFLRKELISRAGGSGGSETEYRSDLLDALHACSMKFSEVAAEVMNCYLDLLKRGSLNENLISFIKEALFKYPNLRAVYLNSVITALPGISDSKSLRNLLWLLGEFCEDLTGCLQALQAICTSIGELPMLAAEEKHEAQAQGAGSTAGANEEINGPTASTAKSAAKPRVLADGTYATESAIDSYAANTAADTRQLPNIRKLFLEGKFDCSGVLANTLCKLVIRLRRVQQSQLPHEQFVALRARALLIMTSILRLGSSKYVQSPIDKDSSERVALAIQIILSGDSSVELEQAMLEESDAAFKTVLSGDGQGAKSRDTGSGGVDAPIDFSGILHGPCFKDAGRADGETGDEPAAPDSNDVDLVLNGRGINGGSACGPLSPLTTSSSLSSSATATLNRVVQLTGFSDPIYAETYVQLTGKEVLLDLLLVNQTEDTLQGVSVELLCTGDLKAADRPPASLTLPSLSFSSVKASFRVTATNHGQIFGVINFFTGPAATQGTSDSVILAEIRIDVLEYLAAGLGHNLYEIPDEHRFREQWVLLEWENKISIKVDGGSALMGPSGGGGGVASTAQASHTEQTPNPLSAFLARLTSLGRLVSITPLTDGLPPSTPFLAANLYARSIFDEEILANVCLEWDAGRNCISGHLRLRSKTQGLAVAYGDKLNAIIQGAAKRK